jgi:hypothetical protein
LRKLKEKDHARDSLASGDGKPVPRLRAYDVGVPHPYR